MSTTVSKKATSTEVTTSADRLRHSFSAMRVSFTWMGTRKSLSSDQRQQAASQFGAEVKFISAGKKLIDTGHPAMRAVNQLRRQMTDFWKSMSLPFPEPAWFWGRSKLAAKPSRLRSLGSTITFNFNMETCSECSSKAQLSGSTGFVRRRRSRRLGVRIMAGILTRDCCPGWMCVARRRNARKPVPNRSAQYADPFDLKVAGGRLAASAFLNQT